MQPESSPPAPAVVAVVVTSDAGPWFPEVLDSLAAQDYPNLSVLVIDAGSESDPTPVVAASAPTAFVRRLERRVGFGTAANEVLAIVEGASHYLFCHDDVALAPDVVRLLVEEAFRSNAGIASPKFVLWDEPDRLLAVGLTTDRVGAARNMVDRGELDQQQHDSVRDILLAPSGATLVRADLFSALGGFDEVVDSEGEDLSLSWRARLAGARLTVVPAARVRHLEATRNGLRQKASPVRSAAHRYRTVLTCYRWYTLLRVVPLALLWALGEAGGEAVRGRGGSAAAILRALFEAWRRPGQLRQARRRVQESRTEGDGALLDMQVRGSTRLRSYLQSRLDDVRSGPSRVVVGDEGQTPVQDRSLWRGNLLLAILLVFILVFGTRGLLGPPLPQIGRLPDTSGGWGEIWRSWWSAWQPGGLGAPGAASPAMALLGVMATVLFGAVGTLQHVVVLGPLLIGPIGAYRAARHWSSRRGQVVAAAFYAVVPVSYNALALGHWDGLIVYAAAPWILAMLVRLSALVPAPVVATRRLIGRLVGLGLLVAVTVSVAPGFIYVVPVVGLSLMAGSALCGRPLAAIRSLAVSVGAAVVAFVLLLPWSPGAITTGAVALGPSPGPAGHLGLGQILRFHTGPFGNGGWEWLLLVAAALPLLVAQEWRLEWAARLWTVALVLFALAWAGQRGWIPPLPLEVVLAPAAAALAGSAALGAAAFEMDLPGYRFGWRQGAAGTAALSLALAAVPFLVASGGGRWDLPAGDASSVLGFLPGTRSGDYRLLWVGSTDAIPLAGRQLQVGFAYGTSFDGPPSLADEWVTADPGASGQLSADLHLVENRLTTRLGHLLAVAGVRYIVIPNHLGPTGSGSPSVPVPTALLAGLGLQTDLHLLNVGDDHYSVYQNDAWAPVRMELPASAVAAAGIQGPDGLRAVEDTDLVGARPVLAGGRPDAASGPIPQGGVIYDGSTYSARWRLATGKRVAGPQPAFGFGMSFNASGPGQSGSSTSARLIYAAPLSVRGGDVVQVILWVAAVGFVSLDFRRRRRPGAPPETADIEWFVPVAPAPRRRTGGARPPARPAAPEPTAEEAWTDV